MIFFCKVSQTYKEEERFSSSYSSSCNIHYLLKKKFPAGYLTKITNKGK